MEPKLIGHKKNRQADYRKQERQYSHQVTFEKNRVNRRTCQKKSAQIIIDNNLKRLLNSGKQNTFISVEEQLENQLKMQINFKDRILEGQFTNQKFDTFLMKAKESNLVSRHEGLIGISKLLPSIYRIFYSQVMEPNFVQILMESAKQISYPYLQEAALNIMNAIAKYDIFMKQRLEKAGWIAVLIQMFKHSDIKIATIAFENIREIYGNQNLLKIAQNNGIQNTVIFLNRMKNKNSKIKVILFLSQLCFWAPYQQAKKGVKVLCNFIANTKDIDKDTNLYRVWLAINAHTDTPESAQILQSYNIVPIIIKHLNLGDCIASEKCISILTNFSAYVSQGASLLIDSGLLDQLTKLLCRYNQIILSGIDNLFVQLMNGDQIFSLFVKHQKILSQYLRIIENEKQNKQDHCHILNCLLYKCKGQNIPYIYKIFTNFNILFFFQKGFIHSQKKDQYVDLLRNALNVCQQLINKQQLHQISNKLIFSWNIRLFIEKVNQLNLNELSQKGIELLSKIEKKKS